MNPFHHDRTGSSLSRTHVIRSIQETALTAISAESLHIARILASMLPQLFLCLQTLHMYHRSHPEVLKLAQQVVSSLRQAMLDRKIISISISDKRFLVDEVPINHGQSRMADQLLALVRNKRVGQVNFKEGVRPTDVVGLLEILSEQADEMSLSEMNRHLEKKGVFSISLGENPDDGREPTIDEGEFQPRIIDDIRQLFLVALDIVKETRVELQISGEFSVWRLDFLLDSFFFHINRNHQDLLALLLLRELEPFSVTHPVNTCILAASIGIQFSQDGLRLRELMRAAFLHDCALLREGVEADDSPEHALEGAEIVDQNEQLEKLVAVCTAEHHQPVGEFPHKVNLFSSIIALADQFDRLLAKDGRTPALALEEFRTLKMASMEAELFAALERLFSPIAPGTIVQLESGEIAIALGRENVGSGLVVKVVTDSEMEILDIPVLKSVSKWQPLADSGKFPAAANLLFRFL